MNPVVDARRLPDDAELKGSAPGTFQFVDGVRPGANPQNLPVNTLPAGSYWTAGLVFVCPGGCGREAALMFRGRCEGDNGGHAWEWDGNEDRPTLAPSVHSKRSCGWHGFLHDGVWRPTSDSSCPGAGDA